jgi:hypothetical protein
MLPFVSQQDVLQARKNISPYLAGGGVAGGGAAGVAGGLIARRGQKKREAAKENGGKPKEKKEASVVDEQQIKQAALEAMFNEVYAPAFAQTMANSGYPLQTKAAFDEAIESAARVKQLSLEAEGGEIKTAAADLRVMMGEQPNAPAPVQEKSAGLTESDMTVAASLTDNPEILAAALLS